MRRPGARPRWRPGIDQSWRAFVWFYTHCGQPRPGFGRFWAMPTGFARFGKHRLHYEHPCGPRSASLRVQCRLPILGSSRCRACDVVGALRAVVGRGQCLGAYHASGAFAGPGGIAPGGIYIDHEGTKTACSGICAGMSAQASGLAGIFAALCMIPWGLPSGPMVLRADRQRVAFLGAGATERERERERVFAGAEYGGMRARAREVTPCTAGRSISGGRPLRPPCGPSSARPRLRTRTRCGLRGRRGDSPSPMPAAFRDGACQLLRQQHILSARGRLPVGSARVVTFLVRRQRWHC